MNTQELQAILDATWDVEHVRRKYGVTGQCVRMWIERNGCPALIIPGKRCAIRFIPVEFLRWKIAFNKQKRNWRRGKNKVRAGRDASVQSAEAVRGRVRHLSQRVQRDSDTAA